MLFFTTIFIFFLHLQQTKINKIFHMAKKKSLNQQKIIAIIAILLGIWAIYSYFPKEEDSEDEIEIANLQSPTYNDNEDEISPETTGFYQPVILDEIDYEKQAQPKVGKNISDKKISHIAYSLSYNKDYRVPNWVFYELTREETEGRLERSNNFQADPEIKHEDAAQLEDYRHSGWDRGHMAPSMDMNWDAKVLDESYLLSNMCPQGHDFNSGIWLDLEHQVRFWARRDSAICVVTGPILPKSKQEKYRRLPNSKVLIPEYFYKAIFAPFAKKPRAIAFVMPNRQQNAKISSFAISIDSLEILTGIDFFSILPDELENEVEAKFNLRDWFRKKDI